MTTARSAAQVTKAIRKAGYAVDCVKGDGYVYFMADDLREIDSVYTCYLSHMSVHQYVDHVASFYSEKAAA